jgi:hypothetical protein
MNNTHYYITDPTAEKGFVELTESEWLALMGMKEVRPYAGKVYRGEMDVSEVPEELREAVAAVVAEKVKRWGLYTERELTAHEALNIITGGNANET